MVITTHAERIRGETANLTFLSLFERNLPRILMARTRSPLSDWISMMVSTVSYKMAWPTFLPDSVFVATCTDSQSRVTSHWWVGLWARLTWARMSLTDSLESLSPFARILISFNTRTYRWTKQRDSKKMIKPVTGNYFSA